MKMLSPSWQLAQQRVAGAAPARPNGWQRLAKTRESGLRARAILAGEQYLVSLLRIGSGRPDGV